MKIFFSYSENNRTHLKSFELAEGSTVDELLEIDDVRQVLEFQNVDYKIGVNGEILDGKFNPKPEQYRLKEGERIEIYRDLTQDPKDRRINKL